MLRSPDTEIEWEAILRLLREAADAPSGLLWPGEHGWVGRHLAYLRAAYWEGSLSASRLRQLDGFKGWSSSLNLSEDQLRLRYCLAGLLHAEQTGQPPEEYVLAWERVSRKNNQPGHLSDQERAFLREELDWLASHNPASSAGKQSSPGQHYPEAPPGASLHIPGGKKERDSAASARSAQPAYAREAAVSSSLREEPLSTDASPGPLAAPLVLVEEALFEFLPVLRVSAESEAFGILCPRCNHAFFLSYHSLIKQSVRPRQTLNRQQRAALHSVVPLRGRQDEPSALDWRCQGCAALTRFAYRVEEGVCHPLALAVLAGEETSPLPEAQDSELLFPSTPARSAPARSDPTQEGPPRQALHPDPSGGQYMNHPLRAMDAAVIRYQRKRSAAPGRQRTVNPLAFHQQLMWAWCHRSNDVRCFNLERTQLIEPASLSVPQGAAELAMEIRDVWLAELTYQRRKEVIIASNQYLQQLYCKAGRHTWTRATRRGRPSHDCPRHAE